MKTVQLKYIEVSEYGHPCMYIDGVFNVMFYVWALVFSSLTQFALNIKLASLERVGVSSDWEND